MTAEQLDHNELSVALGERSYPIRVGTGLIATAGRHMKPLLRQPRVIVVTDENVGGRWLDVLQASLDAEDIAHDAITLPAGERTKDFSHLTQLTGDILSAGIDRGTTLVALGGGVVGDITGFAAAITLRGLDFIQVPTTLLAQVDSSVGGKTGINTPHGKNLVGAFHQPRLVLADTGALDTLPHRQLLAGYAEVVKHGLLGDAEFFAWCEDQGTALLGGDDAARRHAVVKSCEIKAAIVAEDEREAGRRALLNLGHTFGHALEAECTYDDRLLHGEAVAIGCVMAFELSRRLDLCTDEDVHRVRNHLRAAGLPAGLDNIADPSWNADVLMHHMTRDKKVEAGAVAFVLPRGIGDAFVSREVSPDLVRRVLEDALPS